MNLKTLTDAQLHADTKRLILIEREALTNILHHLREIQRRRSFGVHASLFAYATDELGYSEPAAGRRISAMRLLTTMPDLEPKIQAGEINLTHVGLAQSLFYNEKKSGAPVSDERKAELFAAIANQPVREAERIVRSFATVPLPVRESVKSVGEGRNVVTLEVSDEVLAKLEQLKGLLAHSSPGLSHAELIHKLCDLGLAQWNPARPTVLKVKTTSKAAIRRQIWARDGGRCVLCASTYAVQEDHVVPKAKGGAYTLQNMRLLCRTCNQRAAIDELGFEKMDPFLSRSAPIVGAG